MDIYIYINYNADRFTKSILIIKTDDYLRFALAKYSLFYNLNHLICVIVMKNMIDK